MRVSLRWTKTLILHIHHNFEFSVVTSTLFSPFFVACNFGKTQELRKRQHMRIVIWSFRSSFGRIFRHNRILFNPGDLGLHPGLSNDSRECLARNSCASHFISKKSVREDFATLSKSRASSIFAESNIPKRFKFIQIKSKSEKYRFKALISGKTRLLYGDPDMPSIPQAKYWLTWAGCFLQNQTMNVYMFRFSKPSKSKRVTERQQKEIKSKVCWLDGELGLLP